MWNTMHPHYSRDESSENLQNSPYPRASPALLTPPSTYIIDGRRNSTASSLSSLSPTTPICERSLLSDHQNLSGVVEFDMCGPQAMGSLALNYTIKPSSNDETFYTDWSVVPPSMSVNQAMPLRTHEPFPTAPSFSQSMLSNYSGLNAPTTTADNSCWSSCPNSSYSSFASHISSEAGGVEYNALHNAEWSLPLQHLQMNAERTMAPSEAVLGGEFIHVDTHPDTDLSSYDDADVQLPHSPQGVVFKQEADSSDDEKTVKRSIFVSPTGGKTVKREQHHAAGVQKKKSRKSRSKVINRLNDSRFELYLEDDVEPIPGTKRWRKTSGDPDKPQICQLLNPDGSICGKPFKRQEHLHRHEKTHSGRKDFSCQMCNKKFNRNDNCWEHYWTHVLRPRKKNGRNDKCSLRRVLTYIADPKHVEKLLNKWRKEVGYEYDPEDDPMDESEGEMTSGATIKEESREQPLRSEKPAIKSRL